MFITLFFISFSFLQNCLFLLNQHTKKYIKKCQKTTEQHATRIQMKKKFIQTKNHHTKLQLQSMTISNPRTAINPIKTHNFSHATLIRFPWSLSNQTPYIDLVSAALTYDFLLRSFYNSILILDFLFVSKLVSQF